jgi:hypothetical protein
MNESNRRAKREMRFLQFMQLPFLLALLINFSLIIWVPIRQIWAVDPAATKPYVPSETVESPVSPPEESSDRSDTDSAETKGPSQAPNVPTVADPSAAAERESPRAREARGTGSTEHQVREARQQDGLHQALKPPATEHVGGRSSRQVSLKIEPELCVLYPPSDGSEIHYLVNGEDRVLRPGQSDRLTGRQSWKIQFHRGGEFGDAKYELSAGTYQFTAGPQGWELAQVEPDESARP